MSSCRSPTSEPTRPSTAAQAKTITLMIATSTASASAARRQSGVRHPRLAHAHVGCGRGLRSQPRTVRSAASSALSARRRTLTATSSADRARLPADGVEHLRAGGDVLDDALELRAAQRPARSARRSGGSRAPARSSALQAGGGEDPLDELLRARVLEDAADQAIELLAVEQRVPRVRARPRAAGGQRVARGGAPRRRARARAARAAPGAASAGRRPARCACRPRPRRAPCRAGRPISRRPPTSPGRRSRPPR